MKRDLDLFQARNTCTQVIKSRARKFEKKGTAQYDPVIYTPESFKPGFLCVFRLPSNPAPEKRLDSEQTRNSKNVIIIL